MFPQNKDELIKNIIKFSESDLIHYKKKRNFDNGIPHKNVSRLSPYIRRRFISETEILKIILEKNKIDEIEKFIEEIFWRTYWRGWLENHPFIYKSYQNYNENFIPSKTGIKCFDHWTEELIETGYLHNHARMWYASIWIFTLKYTWQSGANFFKKNLIDWCPASNTLGWRWVAGLHTIGKPYIAKAENINFFTNKRFNPKNQLAEDVILSKNNISHDPTLELHYPEYYFSKKDQNFGLVLNKNDLSLNNIFDKININYQTCLFNINEKDNGKNGVVNKFEKALFEDILNNNKNINYIECLDKLINWSQKNQIDNLIIPFETTGNEIFNKDFVIEKLQNVKINLIFYIRDWDKNAFKYANKNFFHFKKRIPHLIEKIRF